MPPEFPALVRKLKRRGILFAACGISVAVENARPGIAELCDDTTPSVVGFIEGMLEDCR